MQGKYFSPLKETKTPGHSFVSLRVKGYTSEQVSYHAKLLDRAGLIEESVAIQSSTGKPELFSGGHLMRLIIVLFVFLMMPIAGNAASEYTLRQEAEQYIVDPCVRHVVQQNPAEGMSIKDQMNLLKTMIKKDMDAIINQSVETTREIGSFADRKLLYDIFRNVCIANAS